MRQFHHIGLPTDQSQPGEFFVEDTRVWVTDPRQHPYKVEYLRFEPDSPVTGPVRDLPHVAYRVDDLDAAIAGDLGATPQRLLAEGRDGVERAARARARDARG